MADLRSWFVGAEDLPGEWRDSEPPGPGFKQLVCEVDIEPATPVNGDAARLSQGSLGPFLAQHVRVHESPDTPSQVVTRLQDALPGCTSYTTGGSREDSPEVTFSVEPIEVDGLPDHAVAWRQTAESGARITTDMVLVARGEVLVAFVSYAVKDDPDPDVLAAAVEALEAKQP